MKKMFYLTIIVLLTGICFGQADQDVKNENVLLRERINKLEAELGQIKEVLNQQKQRSSNQPLEQEQIELTETQIEKISRALQADDTAKNPVWSTLDIQLYGYIKADASFDTDRTTSGNYVVWVNQQSSGDGDNEFNLTARQTRLGMKVKGPLEDGFQASGRAEIDFYESVSGAAPAENKARIQLRHAYMQFDWPEDDFSILAGQTSDVISPLNPYTLNYTVLWDVGNIGYRRPQIRLTKGLNGVKLEGAISRTIGDADTSTLSGEDSGFPTFQGRVSTSMDLIDSQKTTVGISGHWGEEDYATSSSFVGDGKFDTWSLNFDMTQPINEWFSLKGEFFCGENLDTFFGGIGQGINAPSGTYTNEIGSKGGWVAASLGPWDKTKYNVGAGLDDVDASDLSASDSRTLNQTVFGNMVYSLTKNAQIGLELSQWRTQYLDGNHAENFRVQTSFIYKF